MIFNFLQMSTGRLRSIKESHVSSLRVAKMHTKFVAALLLCCLIQAQQIPLQIKVPSVKCAACVTAVDAMHSVLMSNRSSTIGLEVAVKLCKLFKIQSDLICNNLLPAFGGVLQRVFTASEFDTQWTCASLGQCRTDI